MEMIVSASVIAMLTAIFVANFHPARQKNLVNAAVNKLVTDIREVENYALSLKELKNGTPPPRGYLLKFTTDNDYFEVCSDNGDNQLCTNSELYQTRYIFGNENKTENRVIISNLKLDGANRPTIYLIFEPPDPVTIICQNNPTCDDNFAHQPPSSAATITLRDTVAGESKTLEINKFGLVDAAN